MKLIGIIDENKVMVFQTCPFCGERCQVEIDKEGFDKWMGGELIQYALPNVSTETREFLITGMCRDCQEGIFGE